MEDNKIDVILDKKLDGWKSSETNNFVTKDELTVTITLNEYRELLRSAAVSEAEISKVRSENYNLSQEKGKLEKKISDLQARIIDLTNEGEGDGET